MNLDFNYVVYVLQRTEKVSEILKVSAPSLVNLEIHQGHQPSTCSSKKDTISSDQNSYDIPVDWLVYGDPYYGLL